MLPAKFLLVAVSFGLAVTAPDVSGSRLRVRVHSKSTTTCADGEQTIGVAGWDHDGCIASDNVCVAQVSDGDCPDGAYCALLGTGVYGCTAGDDDSSDSEETTSYCADGEQTIGVAGWDHDGCIDSDYVCVAQVSDGDCPDGSYCALLDTGVYGCTAGYPEDTSYVDDGTCDENEQTIGVVGWDHDGCIDSDYVCVAQVSDGDCPAGAYCSLLDTGVYGCVAEAKHKKHHHHKSHQKVTCPSGQQSIGVAGWSQDGCVASGNVCVANTYGSCPSGAHCAWLDTGVYGCMDGAEESTPWEGCASNEDTIGVVGWDHDGCIDSDYVCVAQVSDGDCPAGAYCSLLDTGVYGCVAEAKHKKHHHHKSHQKVTCPSGQQSIGVAGWSQDGCVASGNVCVANTYGSCPSGAHCAWLDTGVYGCMDGAEESTPWEGCASNEDTIGVVGWDHDGCIDSDYVCVAQVSDGDCPAGAYCSLLDTGVYGCVAEAKHKKHHHHKSHQKVTCPSGQQSIGVAGWSQDGCVASGNVCVANTYGSCPSGAHCAWLDTGVYGCMDGAEESTPWEGCASNEDTIGVVGWDHDGCIDSDYVCVAQVSDGDCPAGAYCSLLDTGVYGCVAEAKHKKHHHHKSHQKVTCPSGQQSIGVAGWSQDGCVASGNVCVANTYGSCPSGAHCAWLDTGVYGCMDGAEESTPWEGCASNEDTIGVVGWDHDGCIDSDYVCVAQVSDGDCPAGAYCSLLDTGVYGCVAEAKHKKHHHHKSHQKVTCPSGQQSIGVAGWSQDGCVASGNVCVANTYGSCPSGAHCAWLDTGVYGCMDGAEESTPWEGCASNEDTIGVVGWDHDGCIDSDYVCVAQVSDGDCPAGAYCSLLDTGVYGCVAEAKHKKHHHHKSHQKVTCPSGQQSIGVAGWSQDGCVASGNVCVANTYGRCPSGAHCAWLDTGVYGCMDGAEESTPWEGCASNEDTIGVVGWDHDGCIDSDYVCVAQVSDGDCPAGAYCSLLDTGVYGCVAEAKHKKHHHHKSHQKVTCPSGQQSIGVAGWSQDGCVASGNVCVANTYGSCPSGAHCAWLDTGVYGCMDGAEESTPWEGCASNEDTIGVVGWDHDGCIDSDYVCVAQVSDGDCPAGAYCSLLDTGVYGCVAEAKHKKHHHHHHKKHHN